MRLQHPSTIDEASRMAVEGMTGEERRLLRNSCRRTATMFSSLYLAEVVRYRMLDRNRHWDELHRDFHASCKADGIEGHVPFGEHGAGYIVMKAWERVRAEEDGRQASRQQPTY